MSCRYNPALGYRVLVRGEQDEPCPHDHCTLCNREHLDDAHPQTCPGCVGVVRDNLTAIVDLHDRLEDQATHCHADGRLNTGPLGGDAMVMLADGRYLSAGRLGPDEIPGDPMPPLLVLATHEDDWRIELGHGGGPRATIWRCADYLGTHLTMMAQRHLAFDEFAADLARVRGRLEAVLHDGDREEVTQVRCTNHLCRSNPRLIKVYADTAKNDHYRCTSCGRRYGETEFRDAYAKHLRSEGAERYVKAADARATLQSLGRSERTIRKWFEEGHVGGYCDPVTRETWCWWPDLWRLHLSTKTRRRDVA